MDVRCRTCRRAAVLHAEDFADPRIDMLLDHACQEFPDTAVLAQAVITAHSRADLPRLAEPNVTIPGAATTIVAGSPAQYTTTAGGSSAAAMLVDRTPAASRTAPVSAASRVREYMCDLPDGGAPPLATTRHQPPQRG
ncbi:hypothetical protein [Actinocrispum sp. NPDC049592]|uniref:hypothetical protein n=1 Tax=Actinocrispum sp. NPDC049592 TaxID=3154835 RepID=UPI0034141C68